MQSCSSACAGRRGEVWACAYAWAGVAELGVGVMMHLYCPLPCSGRQVALDVAEGLHHLHTTQRVMHSDLKSG